MIANGFVTSSLVYGLESIIPIKSKIHSLYLDICNQLLNCIAFETWLIKLEKVGEDSLRDLNNLEDIKMQPNLKYDQTIFLSLFYPIELIFLFDKVNDEFASINFILVGTALLQ